MIGRELSTGASICSPPAPMEPLNGFQPHLEATGLLEISTKEPVVHEQLALLVHRSKGSEQMPRKSEQLQMPMDGPAKRKRSRQTDPVPLLIDELKAAHHRYLSNLTELSEAGKADADALERQIRSDAGRLNSLRSLLLNHGHRETYGRQIDEALAAHRTVKGALKAARSGISPGPPGPGNRPRSAYANQPVEIPDIVYPDERGAGVRLGQAGSVQVAVEPLPSDHAVARLAIVDRTGFQLMATGKREGVRFTLELSAPPRTWLLLNRSKPHRRPVAVGTDRTSLPVGFRGTTDAVVRMFDGDFVLVAFPLG